MNWGTSFGFFLLGSWLALSGCQTRSEPRHPETTAASAEQQIVDRAAEAVSTMRESAQFPSFDYYLGEARALLVFPRTIRAALIVGGQGGNGVLVAKGDNGDWSAPAFYSIGGGSIGAQIGYREATVVLFLMNERTLRSVMDRGLTLGTDVSVAAGTVGQAGQTQARPAAADVVQLVSAAGAYAGVSLDGAVLSARNQFNERYYGVGATTAAIVLDRRFDNPGTQVLKRALQPHAAAPVTPVSLAF